MATASCQADFYNRLQNVTSRQQEQSHAMASMGNLPAMNVFLQTGERVPARATNCFRPTNLFLPTGEHIPAPIYSGPCRWHMHWEYHAEHLQYTKTLPHTLNMHSNQGLYSPLWKAFHSRLGYADLKDRIFEIAYEIDRKGNHWSLDASLTSRLRTLESLDLGNKCLSFGQLNEYSRNNPNGGGFRRVTPAAHLLGTSTDYKSTFDIEQDESIVTVNLVRLSSASKYHVESLLCYEEVRDSNIGYRGGFFKLNLNYLNKKSLERTFTGFPKLALEIQALIVQNIMKIHPRRLELQLSIREEQAGTRFSSLEPRGVDPILQVCKKFRAKGTPFHNYVELKYDQRDAGGLIYLPGVDMIYIGKAGAGNLTAKAFKASLLAAECLQKIKSIAISVTHPDFISFMQDFKNYGGLELVFIMLREADKFAGVRKWCLADDQDELVDSRLSSKKEILFEVLHQNNMWATGHTIPGIKSKNVPLSMFRQPEVLEQLVMEMARGDGKERVAPHIRFVRLVQCGKTEEEYRKENERLEKERQEARREEEGKERVAIRRQAERDAHFD